LDKHANGDAYSGELSDPFGYMDADGFAYTDCDLDFYFNNDEQPDTYGDGYADLDIHANGCAYAD
jgi:hypothetical protein